MSTSLDITGLLLKAESSYGTDAAPVGAADGLRLSDRTAAWIVDPDYAYPNERDTAVSGDLLPVAPGNPEGRVTSLSFGWEVRGKGSAYTAVGQLGPAGAALAACGFTESFGAGALTFTLGSQTRTGVTIWAYAGGKLFKVTGCQGTVEWTCPAGEITLLTFTMQGMVRQAVTEVALPSITSYNTQIPPAFVNASASLNDGSAWSPDLVESTVTTGADVVREANANAVDGIGGFTIARYRASVSVRAKERSIASGFNPYTGLDQRKATTIDWTVGATASNRAKLDVNTAYLTGIQHEDQDGLAGWNMTYGRIGHLALVFD